MEDLTEEKFEFLKNHVTAFINVVELQLGHGVDKIEIDFVDFIYLYNNKLILQNEKSL